MGPRPPTEHSPHSQIPLPLLVSNMIRNITRLSSVLPKRVITPKSLITVKQFHSTRPLLSSNKMSQPFLAAIQKRRTYYSISPELPSGNSFILFILFIMIILLKLLLIFI